MRTLTWRTGCIAVAFAAALISHPRTSFGVLDCSYGGAFDPPLPFDPVDGGCLASGPLQAQRGLNVTFANSPLSIGEEGVTLQVTNKLPGVFLAPGSFNIDAGGLVETHQDILHPVWIDAHGDLRNTAGVLYLAAPQQQVRLRARGIIKLEGNPVQFNPPNLIWGDYVKIITTLGSIELINTLIIGSQPGVDIVAPKGDVILKNVAIFALQEGGKLFAPCRFQILKKTGQLVGLNDPSNTLICIPKIKK